jgi:hypothetical protein
MAGAAPPIRPDGVGSGTAHRSGILTRPGRVVAVARIARMGA